MKDLTLTQEYYVCVVNEKGSLPSYENKMAACLVAAGVLEMQLENCISMEDKKISVCKELPEKLTYLKPLYEVICQEKQPVKASKIVEAYLISFTDKKLRELIESVMNELKAADRLTAVKAGLLGNKEGYAPKKEVIDSVVEKIRAELLEEGELTDDTVALTALLERAGCLKKYFSKYEQKALKTRMKEISSSEAGASVKEMSKCVDDLCAAIAATNTVLFHG